ncbi:hypothetical protein TRFO_43332 [Tritrichomonas foetus]|nr:hypothetical protein TRFO_43332 [Tritrichomonas foetus]|eukprot:OHT13401.1 hypothetical protein TRFO_43332 [Tritrichomonas foetus]
MNQTRSGMNNEKSSWSNNYLNNNFDNYSKELLFVKFLNNFKDTLKIVNIPIEMKLSSEPFTQRILNSYNIPSIALSGGSISTSLTDIIPDFNRSNNFAWAFSEAILHTIFDLPLQYELISRSRVDTSFWASSIGRIPRVAPFIDENLPNVFKSWMEQFSEVSIDTWKSKGCFAPYSATDCVLHFYNQIPIHTKLAFLAMAILYGIVVFLIMTGITSVSNFVRNLSCI